MTTRLYSIIGVGISATIAVALLLSTFDNAGTSTANAAPYQIPQLRIGETVDTTGLDFQTTTITNRAGPQAFLDEGGDGVVVISTDVNYLEIERGSTASVPLTITYTTNTKSTNAPERVTVVYDRISGTLFPPSVVKSITMEKMIQLTQEGKPIDGAIDLTQFVSLNPNSILLSSGESKTVMMKITIPLNFTDEKMDAIDFSPTFTIPNEGSSRVGIITTSIGVKIVE